MKHDYFSPVPADYTGYSVLTHSHGKRVTVFKGHKVVTGYAAVPRELIRQVAEYKGLKMLQITQITRIDDLAASVKFSNGVIRYYDNERKIWIASERETAAILKALG